MERNITPTCYSLCGLCKTWKAVILILVWTVFIGAMFFIVFNLTILILLVAIEILHINVSFSFTILYSIIALVHIFYPLSGFFADVFFGRFKTIIISTSLFICSVTILLLCFMLQSSILALPKILLNIVFAIVNICLFIAFIGISGYGANFIQFGLDQLLEAPSHHQALFVHWAKWCYDLMLVVIICFYSSFHCISQQNVNIALGSPAVVLLLILLLLFLFVFWKRRWFFTEPGHQNPYKIAIKVLSFTWKYKYPLYRSAFTYCDDEMPSRLDYAKERYGGPFTTEQVEDVKTILKILAVLLAVGPVSTMDVPTSTVLFILIGIHEGTQDSCQPSSIVVNQGVLRYATSTIFLPLYMWIIFSLVKNKIPKILYRLGFGIFLYILGVLSILVVDIAGHLHYHGNRTQTQTLCLLNFTTNDNNLNFVVPSLKIHWAAFIPSNLLIGIGPTLVTVTIFEFISAQGPHSMKGLLLGTHYAITGAFQFISSVAIVPFALQEYWVTSSMIGCLFGYLLFNCAAGLIGFILFLVAAKWYRYRERDDRPYDQRFVIDVYNRYLNQASDYSLSDSYSESDQLLRET